MSAICSQNAAPFNGYKKIFLHKLAAVGPRQTLQVNDSSCSLQGVASSSWRLLQLLQHVAYHVLAMVYLKQFMCNDVLAKKSNVGGIIQL